MSDFPLFLAKERGVTRRTVTRWCEEGRIPGAYRTRGGHWRLRKPRSGSLRHCDRHIAEFVLRYTSEQGYLPPGPDENRLLERLWQLVERKRLHVLPPEVLPIALDRLMWDWADQMEKVTATREFNEALEFSSVAYGFREPDVPRTRDFKQWQKFEKDHPEHFPYLIGPRKADGSIKPTPILEQIHPRAFDAISTPHGMLYVKAEKLRLENFPVTPKSLAQELRISVSTLYKQHGRDRVRQVCGDVRPELEQSKLAKRKSERDFASVMIS